MSALGSLFSTGEAMGAGEGMGFLSVALCRPGEWALRSKGSCSSSSAKCPSGSLLSRGCFSVTLGFWDVPDGVVPMGSFWLAFLGGGLELRMTYIAILLRSPQVLFIKKLGLQI